jgi:hypothetical protein
MIGKDRAPTRRNSASPKNLERSKMPTFALHIRWVTTGQGAWRRRERSRTW